MKKNLVLGLINYYTFFEFQKFVKSLRNIGYEDDIILFVGDGMTRLSLRMLKKYNVKTIHFRTIRELPKDSSSNRKFNFNPETTHNNYRWYLYYDFLEKHRDEYDHIFLTDVKDVYFQKNPFSIQSTHSLIFFLEGKNQTIEEDTIYNGLWVEHIYGKEGLKKVGNNYISCCGTVLGAADSIFRYVELLLNEYDKISDCSLTLDQGIHNYLLYSNVFSDFDLLPNEAGGILTIANESSYQVDKDSLIRTTSGKIYSVIHQFDRIEYLVKLTDKLYGKSGFLKFIFKKFYRFDLLIHRIRLRFR